MKTWLTPVTALCLAAALAPLGQAQEPDTAPLGQAEDEELRRYISLLRETAGGLFTRAPEEPEGILQHTDEAGLARLIDEADTVLRF